MFKKVLSVSLTAILLFGCGGGGSGKKPQPPPPAILGSSHLPSAERVVEYLRTHASGGPWEGCCGTFSDDPGLVRFTAPPTIRLATGISERERAMATYAIALINRALPYEQHLQLGPDAPANVEWPEEGGLPGIPDGEIFVEFRNLLRSSGVARLDLVKEYDTQQERWEKKHLRASAVRIDPDDFQDRPDWQFVSVLVHELGHALGFAGHPGQDFADSNMENAWFRLDGSLPDIDMAALQVLLLRLEEDTEPEDLSIQGLGAWDDESTDITGVLGPVFFGVRHANDVSVPFTAGPEPSTSLVESGLSGIVTWRGKLLGLSPELRTVAGDAAVGVDLATMNGTASFTNLKLFSALVVPTPEEGNMWGDGTLDYDIRVGSNYLYSTGGDAGVVSGSFYGENHGYVGGTVERSDLTAAFGGKR